MAWGLIAFLLGIAYGWAKPGNQDKSEVLKTGVILGVVLGIVFILLGLAVGFAPLGLAMLAGFLAFVVELIVLTVIFVLGVWAGDWLEGMRAPGTRRVG